MTLAEKLEKSVRWSRAHRGDADARAYGADGEPVCIVCGERIVRTHGGSLPKVCPDCRDAYNAGFEISRRKVDGQGLVAAIQRAAEKLAGVAPSRGGAMPKRGFTPYRIRRRRLDNCGTERVTTWRGMPCMGGGYALNKAAALAPAWDAPEAPKPAAPKKKRKDGAGGAKPPKSARETI